MYICKWCGREFKEHRMKGAGGWAVCSESCRQQLSASVASGDTEKFSRTAKTPILLVAVLACLAYATFTKGCEGTATNEPDAASVTAPASGAGAEDSPARVNPTPTAGRAKGAQHTTDTFGEPGQFDEPTTNAEPSTASYENIQTIPAPTPEASDTAF